MKPEHTHPISATCIQFDGDKAYASWHEKGEGIHGCVEVFDVKDSQVELLAWAEDPKTDYNHLIVDRTSEGTRLLAVGHNEKAAIVGEMKLNGGTFTQGAKLSFTTLRGNSIKSMPDPEFYGGDGNCIVRNGDYLRVASYGGYHTLNLDLTRLTRYSGAIATPGSAKHLALSSDGTKLLTLNLSTRNADESPAELRIYDATDYTWETPTLSITDFSISPIDGKNVIALDTDGSIYACLGFNGLRKYDSNGNLVKKILVDGSPVNGMAIDGKYLYVACGKGLLIYDKSDLSEPACYYRHSQPSNELNKLASCNYVAVNNNGGDHLIYLAYGLDGIEVLRMSNY